ncbi:MAG TPA: TetR/AcrR family transcriptional regulator [Propionibacteriaceae bacterium]|nr:TetR/AcrR family transcriptional regulator [Propionibacteriaceae bacterium]
MVAVFPEPRLTSRQTHLRDALVEMVLREGFSRLTMDQVAAGLNCSKRTLYALAASKEQLAVLAVRHFFKRATEQVETAIAATRNPARRVTGYLEAVAEALRPASRAFRDDLAHFAPAAEIYEQNTVAAAHRVRELIDEGTRAGVFRRVPAQFVSEVVTATMRRITSGEITAATGLSDAEAYAELARLVVAAVRR